MNTALSSEASRLLDLYHTASLCDSADRSKLSKLITIYNRKNPTEKLKTYHLIHRNFPTFVQYLLNKFKLKEDQIFENNFIKPFFNLHILPTHMQRTGYSGRVINEYACLAPYKGLRNTYFEDAYKSTNVTFKDIATGELYRFTNGYFVNINNPSFFVHLYNLNVLSLFIEV